MIYRLSIVVFLFLSTARLMANPGDAASLVDDGWKAWERGDHAAVEQKFRQALEQDPANARAYLGLSFLYSLQRKHAESWQAFSAALERVPNAYPYIFASWVTPKLRSNLDEDSGVLDMMERLTEQSDSLGILKAMAHEVLGSHYEARNKLSASRDHYARMNAIVDWMVVGPFDNVSASGHAKVYPPEQEYKPDVTYSGKDDVPARWFKVAAVRNDRWIDMLRYFADYHSIFYANTFVYSPKKQTVHLRIGTSGSYRLFLNDEMISESTDEYNNDLDSYLSETTLQEGWNRVLVKTGFSEIERCNFMLRITDTRGGTIPDLRVSIDPQSYRSKPGAAVTQLDNFTESFFKKQIAANPNHLENYLLLADAYLRNDKAVDAELTLRDAIKRAPNNALLHNHMLEAYMRGKKQDEIIKTLDRIHAIDKNVPSAIEYKFYEHLEKEEYDKAETYMNQLERLMPGSEDVYQMKIEVYGRKEQIEKLIETNERAYKLFPTNPKFVMAQAYIASATTKSADAAISIAESYLDRSYSEFMLSHLAELYLSKSDVTKWRSIYDQLFELDPATPGYYQQISDVYVSMQDYGKAKEAIMKAIEICPVAAVYWGKLAEIERIQGNNREAAEAYRKALTFYPTDYDSRSALRELEGRKSVFEQFSTIDVDSLIRNAPSAEAYPEEKGVILLDDAQRVVYEGGASESSQEMVVKVFNSRGIDDWKEYYIPHNSYSEELIVDKAVVVKEDGSETKADISGNEVIFKTLEPNDILHLKWRVKNHYSGKLSRHFWDTYYFNTYYPTSLVRYSLITPKEFKFKYTAQNMKVEPTKNNVEDGTLHTWTLRDLPAISYEYGMPTLDDVGQVLYISSIENWKYLVDWYADITKSKAKSTYEIKEQVQNLLKEKAVSTDEEKMKLVYDFITENIRYSSVAFRQSAYTPQKARDVLVNKIGDCKDVATLCIAMLGELDVKADYVLVNTRDEGLNKSTLPSIAFNHCIVAVETKGGMKYLDLTADNYPIGSLPHGDMEAFALVIKPGTTAPTYLEQRNGIARTASVKSQVELREDNAMVTRRNTRLTGSLCASVRGSMRNQAKKEQEKMFLSGLSSSYPNVKLTSLDFENLDNLEPEVRFSYSYEVPNYLSDAGSFKFLKIPWSHGAEADQALSYEKRAYPYAYWPSEDTLMEEVEIVVPKDHIPVDLPTAVQYKSPIAEYSLKYTFTNGKLMARRTYINKKSMVEPTEYAEFKKFYNDVVKEDTRQILLKKKGVK